MVGVVTAFLCVPISTAAMLVDVASCVVSPLIVDGVVEDKRYLFPRGGVADGPIPPFSFWAGSSRFSFAAPRRREAELLAC